MVNFSCVAFYPNGKVDIVSKTKYDWSLRINKKLPTDCDDQHVINEACISFHSSESNEKIKVLSLTYFLIKEFTITSDKEFRVPFANSGCTDHPIILFYASKEKYKIKGFFIPSDGFDQIFDTWSIRSFNKTYMIHPRRRPSLPVPKHAFVLYNNEDNGMNLKTKSTETFESVKVPCDYLHFIYAYDTSESKSLESNQVDFISDQEIREASTHCTLTFTERIGHWTTKKITKLLFASTGIIYIPEIFVLSEAK